MIYHASFSKNPLKREAEAIQVPRIQEHHYSEDDSDESESEVENALRFINRSGLNISDDSDDSD